MEFKNKIMFEKVYGEGSDARVYQIYMPKDNFRLGEAYDACYECLGAIVEESNRRHKLAEPQKEEAAQPQEKE